jgi:hypothetical protein
VQSRRARTPLFGRENAPVGLFFSSRAKHPPHAADAFGNPHETRERSSRSRRKRRAPLTRSARRDASARRERVRDA